MKVTIHQITNASDNKELALWNLKSVIHVLNVKKHLDKHSGKHRVSAFRRVRQKPGVVAGDLPLPPDCPWHILPSSPHRQSDCFRWDLNGNYFTIQRDSVMCKQFMAYVKINRRSKLFHDCPNWGNRVAVRRQQSLLSPPSLCRGYRGAFLNLCFRSEDVFLNHLQCLRNGPDCSRCWSRCSFHASPYPYHLCSV